ncbi:MAG: outer membrane beta-barrel protein [candidate division Zixibacteria bacterium]|nr:outer membrane beta-barrel protein [candidate division Zixibacteria bacterium]
MKRIICFCLLVYLTLAISAMSAVSLAKRHQIGLSVGMCNQATGVRTAVSMESVSTTVDNSGVYGGLKYGYWAQENLAFTFEAGAMASDVENEVDGSGVSTSTASVAPIRIGMKYYFLKTTPELTVRPFFDVAFGPYVGTQTKSEVGTEIVTESRTETTIGGRLGMGMDIILSRKFVMETAVGYNLMSDFSQPIGGSKNYSGPEFRMGIGFVFGKGTEN